VAYRLIVMAAGVGWSEIPSIAKAVGRLLYPDWGDSGFGLRAPLNNLLGASGFLLLSFYVYGNAVKYRYNIPLTMLALFLLHIVLMVGLIMMGNVVGEYLETNYKQFRILAEGDGKAILWGVGFVLYALGALLWWRAWRRYKKARFTSKLNP